MHDLAFYFYKLIAGTLLLVSSVVFAQAQEAYRQKDGTPCYFIAVDAVVKNSPTDRQMTILLDPLFFTEADLRKLAEHLLQKYPEPEEAHISLKSNVDQLRDMILNRIVQNEANEADWKYPLGVIIRNKGNELIRYSDPKGQAPGSVIWKTIIMKGRDTARSK